MATSHAQQCLRGSLDGSEFVLHLACIYALIYIYYSTSLMCVSWLSVATASLEITLVPGAWLEIFGAGPLICP